MDNFVLDTLARDLSCEHFRSDGVVGPVRLLSRKEAFATRTELLDDTKDSAASTETLILGDDLSGRGSLYVHFGRSSQLTAVLALPLADLAANLLGVPEAALLSDETLIKPARNGAEISWHQDWPVYPDLNESYLTCWLALDDVSAEASGAVEYAIGSHTVGKFLPAEFAAAPVPDPRLLELERVGMRPLPTLDVGRFRIWTAAVGAGMAVFHHSEIWHRSSSHVLPRDRVAIALRYRPLSLEKARDRDR